MVILGGCATMNIPSDDVYYSTNECCVNTFFVYSIAPFHMYPYHHGYSMYPSFYGYSYWYPYTYSYWNPYWYPYPYWSCYSPWYYGYNPWYYGYNRYNDHQSGGNVAYGPRTGNTGGTTIPARTGVSTSTQSNAGVSTSARTGVTASDARRQKTYEKPKKSYKRSSRVPRATTSTTMYTPRTSVRYKPRTTATSTSSYSKPRTGSVGTVRSSSYNKPRTSSSGTTVKRSSSSISRTSSSRSSNVRK